MRQIISHPPEDEGPRHRVPRLSTVYALAAYALLLTVGLAMKARTRFSRPPPNWMTDADRWYDGVLGALFYATVAASCFLYLRYRARLKREGTNPTPRPWRLRREVRVALWVLSAICLLQLPVGVYRTFAALNDPSTPAFADNLMSAFPIAGLLSPLSGLAILLYDHRRVTREQRQTGGLCSACGYDLRATPSRCPECGTVTGPGHPAASPRSDPCDANCASS